MSISGPEVAQNLCVAHDNDSEGVDVRGEDDDQGDQFIFLLPSPGRDTVQLGPSNFMFHFVIHGEGDRDEEGHYWRNKRKTVLNVIGELLWTQLRSGEIQKCSVQFLHVQSSL